MRRVLVVACACVIFSGCLSGISGDLGNYMPQALAVPQLPQRPLLAFGGENHDVYLGCLNCPAEAPDSIVNPYGIYGNPYKPDGLWNPFSPYVNPLSALSVCNPLASSPPVIVDPEGRYYGELTSNTARLRRNARYSEIIAIGVCR